MLVLVAEDGVEGHVVEAARVAVRQDGLNGPDLDAAQLAHVLASDGRRGGRVVVQRNDEGVQGGEGAEELDAQDGEELAVDHGVPEPEAAAHKFTTLRGQIDCGELSSAGQVGYSQALAVVEALEPALEPVDRVVVLGAVLDAGRVELGHEHRPNLALFPIVFRGNYADCPLLRVTLNRKLGDYYAIRSSISPRGQCLPLRVQSTP